jgi:glycosyltransferase involved in cell wall biosynthesis
MWEKTGMKLLFVAHDGDLGGATTPIVEAIAALAPRGHTAGAILPREGTLAPALAKLGVPWAVLPVPQWASTKGRRRFRNLLANYRALPALVLAIEKFDPDMVVSASATIGIAGPSATNARVPHMWWLQEFGREDHNLEFNLGDRATAWLMRRHCTGAIANSNAVADKFAAFVGRERISRVDYYIKPIPPAAAPPFKPPGAFHMVLAGSLNPQKGQADAIEAMCRLRTRDVHLHLFGSGGKGYTARLRERAETLGMEERVHFHGHSDGVVARMAQADAVLVTSRCEAFGRVTVEAMRTGVPVIGTDAGGTRELIEAGRTGLLYPPGDAAALAEAIEHLIANPQHAAALGRAGKAWADPRFGEAQFADALEAALRRALPNPAQTA